ncbi:uncharacterized protein GIQ15_05810 [Arthroderma uncinatum]|uniref:uncharacterized protein n=1 Tax=Arthroderma uncinatum TaxID=74035 RepID=UPI00144AE4F9|nr:uncharacterized protein GIQ15_05810 [Arthroderma uncinatum]KAF3480463.1 hypothetical protein GIQ15_05810 [Arthroderma uncinatum]
MKSENMDSSTREMRPYNSDSDDSSDPEYHECVNGHYKQLVAAIQGEMVPNADDLDRRLGLPCLIRGSRCHYKFAISSEVKEICASRPEFAHAHNSRLIMSDVAREPEDMDDLDKTKHPYCIWYPDLAKEGTYSQLVQRFPSMRYQVRRSCAAAGYAGLLS